LQEGPGEVIKRWEMLASIVAERVALAIANLKLRQTLHMQSIRDLLTGLLNRRYMDESLERELRRATRLGRLVGLVMFDIDHFSVFNRTFGHEAGDAVLRELGEFIRQKLNIYYLGRLLDGIAVSIGLAIFPQNGMSAELLLNAAKGALITAKENGGDQVKLASE
jgi:GGDEF domain-containing protein